MHSLPRDDGGARMRTPRSELQHEVRLIKNDLRWMRNTGWIFFQDVCFSDFEVQSVLGRIQ